MAAEPLYDNPDDPVEILRMLRAVAYSSPEYRDRLQAARDGNPGEFAPAEQLVPGWPTR